MHLEGTHCLVRPWAEADIESLVRHANNRAVWRNLKETFPHPYTEADARDWLAIARCEQGLPLSFAIEVDGEAAGGIGFKEATDVLKKTFNVGYWIGEALWGRGLATEALGLVTAYGFDHFDITRIEAFVYAWNPASGRVLEKCGYIREATLRSRVFKDGEIVDQFVYAKLRG